MDYCNKCGNKLKQEDIFCSKCGNKIVVGAAPTEKLAGDDKRKYDPVRLRLVVILGVMFVVKGIKFAGGCAASLNPEICELGLFGFVIDLLFSTMVWWVIVEGAIWFIQPKPTGYQKGAKKPKAGQRPRRENAGAYSPVLELVRALIHGIGRGILAFSVGFLAFLVIVWAWMLPFILSLPSPTDFLASFATLSLTSYAVYLSLRWLIKRLRDAESRKATQSKPQAEGDNEPNDE